MCVCIYGGGHLRAKEGEWTFLTFGKDSQPGMVCYLLCDRVNNGYPIWTE